ncbi:MAG: hypothetical protein AB7Q23_14390 [Hyphomonadaceae bacterium]
MRSVKVLPKRPAANASGKGSYSTSQGRANLASALETAGTQHVIVGFDRYGHPIAALVSLDAVRLIAGYEDQVQPQVRNRLVRMARVFLAHVRSDGSGRAPRKKAAPKVSKKKTPARRKTAKAKRRARR